MKTFNTVLDFFLAVRSGEIPDNVVSPVIAAALLGVTRQAINDRLHNGKSLRAWRFENTVLICSDSVKAAIKKNRPILER